MKNSFVLYKMWSPMIAAMTDNDAGRILKAVYAYQVSGESLPDGDPLYPVFAMIRQQFQQDDQRYEETCKRNRENVNKRWNRNDGIQNDTTVYDRIRTNTNYTDSDSDSDSDKTLKDKKKKNRRFSPPSLSEVQAYCDERKNGINAQKFLDFYESRGWKYGDTKITDWKACVRTWENRAKENPPLASEKPKPKLNQFNGFSDRHTYDFDALASVLAQDPGG